MKKEYIAPLMEVVRTEAEEMICQSLGIKSETFDSGTMTIGDKEDASSIFEDLW